MQPVEKVNKSFLAKLLLLCGLLYLGFVMEAPPFVKTVQAKELNVYTKPNEQMHKAQHLQDLYIRVVPEPEETAI